MILRITLKGFVSLVTMVAPLFPYSHYVLHFSPLLFQLDLMLILLFLPPFLHLFSPLFPALYPLFPLSLLSTYLSFSHLSHLFLLSSSLPSLLLSLISSFSCPLSPSLSHPSLPLPLLPSLVTSHLFSPSLLPLPLPFPPLSLQRSKHLLTTYPLLTRLLIRPH